jgi:thiamine biosynthesis protein ThiS
MKITVNGKSTDIAPVKSLKELLTQLGYDQPFIAVALNQTCIARREREHTAIRENDDIEILTPQAGG